MKKTLIFCLLLGLFGCTEQLPVPPEIGVEEFIVDPGFEINVVASEPLLNTPLAIDIDLNGRIWAVELPGYMRDIDGSEEHFPDGKIVLLEDKNRDGRMESRKIIVDSLVAPRALALVYGGLLYAEPPLLYWVSIDDQDKPGEKVAVDSFFAVGGNIEHQPNGLMMNLDNWIYNAKSSVRYRRFPDGTWKKEATAFRGQWGISSDDYGRLVYNDNSNGLQGDFLRPNQLTANPYQASIYGTNLHLSENNKLYPYQPTAVNRGYIPGVLDSMGKLDAFTSACSPLVYRGSTFGETYYGNAFVCGPEANLIKRYILSSENGKILGQQAYDDHEFLISKEESFRPVSLYNSPDGSMLVVDIRKGIIQHRAYMSNYLREAILNRGLDTINGLGRIYRISKIGEKSPKLPNFQKLSPRQWVDLLKDKNGWTRQKAQQQLVFLQDKSIVPDLEALAMDDQNHLPALHALWTLEGLNSLDPGFIRKMSELALHPQVVNALLQLAGTEGLGIQWEQAKLILDKAWKLNLPEVELQLAHTTGKFVQPEAIDIWTDLAAQYKNDELFCEALLSGIYGREKEFLQLGLAKGWSKDKLITQLNNVLINIETQVMKGPQIPVGEVVDRRTKSMELYGNYCGTCHGQDGMGISGLAPPIYQSEYLSGRPEKLILVALNGLRGPVTVRGQIYHLNAEMPALKSNPELNDADIAGILSFIRNAFSNNTQSIRKEDVAKIRQQTADRKDLFTEEELENWLEVN